MIHFTTIESSTGAITKVISKQPDGSMFSDGSICRVVRGRAFRRSVADEGEFAALINAMPANTAVVMGQLRADLPDAVDVVPVATLARTAPQALPTIARTREFLGYDKKSTVWLLVDVDGKYLTAPIIAALEALAAGEPRVTDDPRFTLAATVLAALNKLFPGIAAAGIVMRRSTSAGIVDTETGTPCLGKEGFHIYLKVADGTDVRRALRSMHDRLFLCGLSWIDLGRAGQYLERSIVDRAVGGPEHLAFEGAPSVLPPLRQDPQQRVPLYRSGAAIETRAIIPPFIRDTELARIKRQLKGALSAQRAEVQAAYRSERVAELVNQGVSEPTARRSVDRALTDGMPVLDPYQILQFDDPDLGDVMVADVLQDPERYVGQTLADPFEGVAYGRCKALVMRKREGGWFINSFAHGGIRYDLKYDVVHLRQAIEALDIAQQPEAFARLYLLADLSAVELEQLRRDIASRCGIGLRTLAALMKAAALERNKVWREVAIEERRREREERGDLSAEHPVPRQDGEIGPVMDLLNAAMHPYLDAPAPPMRNEGTGQLMRLSERIPEVLQTISQVHQLTAAGANDSEANMALPRLPPVGYTRLVAVQEAELPEYLETYVRFHNEIGNTVRLPAPYVRPFLLRSFDTALPVVRGVITTPLVMFDGELIAGQYLDRKLGLLVRTPPELSQYLPTIVQCTPKAVADAVKFLLDEFLIDVATDLNGKAMTIALLATVIERTLLPERPGFMVTAGQQAAGKTTLLNATSQAVLGRYCNAVPWSTSEEERRKRLMAVFLAQHPMVAWDNVKAGSVISCQKLGLSLTSPTYNDRILGVSEEAEAPACCIQCLTGNNIGSGGELASRLILIRLLTTRLDPQNRAFAHVDFIGWVQANRVRILQAVYTILLGNFHGRTPDPQVSGTRFRTWYFMVGGAIERAMEQYLHYHGGGRGNFSVRGVLLEQQIESTGNDGLSALHQFIAGKLHAADPSRRWRDGFTMADAADFACQPSPEALEFNQLLHAVTGMPVLVRPSAKQAERRFRAILDTPSNVYTAEGRSETVCISADRSHEGHTYRLRVLANA
jgi:hypothetical protein